MASQPQNISRYTINFDTLAKTLLPFALRRSRIVNLLHCIHAPLRTMYADFTRFRTEKEYRLAHSGQVCSLEKVLNDSSPVSGIYITDGVYTEDVLLPADGSSEYANYQVYFPADANDTEQVYIGTGGTFFDGSADFIIHFPVALQSSNYTDAMNKLIALADMYKLAGKRYEINYY